MLEDQKVEIARFIMNYPSHREDMQQRLHDEITLIDEIIQVETDVVVKTFEKNA